MKKLLLIAYYWPPAGGAGVLRWLRFCRYLPQYGWQPSVLTTQSGDYPFTDESLVAPDVRVIRAQTPTYGAAFRLVAGRKAKLPYGDLRTNKRDPLAKRLMFWARTNLVIPDARVMWKPFAVRAAIDELRRDRYDAVVTTGPPHSVHLAGLAVKRRFGLPWLADFRDPWSRISWLSLGNPSQLTRKIHEKLERDVFAASDAQAIFSPYFVDKFPAGRKQVLYNGYDEAEMEGLARTPSDKFRIKYVGRVTAGREIAPLMDALQALHAETPDIEMSFVGTYEQPPAEFAVRWPEVQTQCKPFGPHRQALEEAMNAEIVVLLTERYADTRGIIPLKLFEYIGARTYVLGLGDPAGESSALLRRYEAGRMIAYDDAQGLAETIRQRYALWRNGDDSRIPSAPELSAQTQTAQLADILESITEKEPRS